MCTLPTVSTPSSPAFPPASGPSSRFEAQLAARSLSLVLVACRKQKLQAPADQLRADHGTAIESVELDHRGESAVDESLRRTSHLDVGVLVASAGIATAGPFLDTPLAEESALINLDLAVPMQLAHAYGRLVRKERRGAIILRTSSFGSIVEQRGGRRALVASREVVYGFDLIRRFAPASG
ncbi:SDR family NAD(P)-dependent oxidoreductase [Streptomyces sp. NPDC055134]